MTYPHMPFNHLDEEMVFVTMGKARLTFSAIPIQQILPVDELAKSKIRGRSPVEPANRFQQFDAPAGTVAIYPARNNHTISAIDHTPTAYFVMRFFGRKVAARLVQQHETLALGPGELSQTRIFHPTMGALAAWHQDTRVVNGGSTQGASPAPTVPKTERLSDRVALAGGETVQLDSTVVPVGAQHTAAHPGCDTFLLLLSGDAHLDPSAKVLRKLSVAVIPSGIPYTLRNVGDEPAVLYAARFCPPSN
jgi:mannose-6-phosphate isomerase-like protein (cupin superfamily)